jgi:hypothetical protein
MTRNITQKPTGRPAKGSLVWKKNGWHARITIAGGKRRLVRLDPNISQEDRDAALAGAQSAAVYACRVRATAVGSHETVAEYSGRWLAARQERGLTTVEDDRSRLNKWALPLMGAQDIQSVQRQDLEHMVEDLDKAVRADKLGWKTASHVWMLIRLMFREACSSKLKRLRVRTDNPGANIQGPDKGARKAKTFLYPSEFIALVSCEDVPLEWRETFAVTTYLNLRAGEAHALT